MQVQDVELVQGQQVDDPLDLLDGEEAACHVQRQPAPGQGRAVAGPHARHRTVLRDELCHGRRAPEESLGRPGGDGCPFGRHHQLVLLAVARAQRERDLRLPAHLRGPAEQGGDDPPQAEQAAGRHGDPRRAAELQDALTGG
ncbi:hypothetical protein GCM10020220_078320 [Nonomuraea rubra]